MDSNGTLTFQVATNQYGTNNILLTLYNSGSTNNGGKNSATNSLALDVAFVNQPPSYALAAHAVLVQEESGPLTAGGMLTSLSPGPPSESWQTLTLTTITSVGNATNAAFQTMPNVDANGTLTFTPKAHSFGTNLVTVVAKDNGGTGNGGIDSYTNSFLIDVAQIAHAPNIALPTNTTVLENASNGLTVAINVWNYHQTASNVVFTATSLNTNLATVIVKGTNIASGSNVVYTVTFLPGTNRNGTVTNQLVASAGGFSTTNMLVLTITPVNQPPYFFLWTNVCDGAGGLWGR